MTGGEPGIELAARMIGQSLAQAVEQTAQAVVDAARAELQSASSNKTRSRPSEPPIDHTGRLAASLRVERFGPAEAKVASDAPEAVYLELGTARMAPRPFLLPAAERAMAELKVDLHQG
ncbi:MAG: HK97 gp10 family phage protein [Fimbriimonas ginsengisoli]|uniref:HK97 gp10 family phage protein n=1 Tax=Fimbriimonas ginsengisoli TaxID=1005039 RepID=A0A931LU58_FIMGI|nr:HK97 gp10 family phage protein [Fimbriimonas ginsengisoli]